MTDLELFDPDANTKATFVTDELSRQYHDHLRKKEIIRDKIEALVREKNFLEQLKPSDMAYMKQKEIEFEAKEAKLLMDDQVSPPSSPKREYYKSFIMK